MASLCGTGASFIPVPCRLTLRHACCSSVGTQLFLVWGEVPMPRIIEIALSSEKTEPLLEGLDGLDGVVGIAVQRSASLRPKGDILTIQATNEATRSVLRIVSDLQVLDGGSVQSSEPRSLISRPYQNGIDRESNETIWDDMAFTLRKETNVSANYASLMTLSGAVAAVGLWTDTVHIVVGAMVIAPGFVPLLRIPFGWIAGPRAMSSRGLLSTAVGYLAMAAGAALMFWILHAVDPTRSAGLNARSWIQYWSRVTGPSTVLAFVAGAAGAFVVAAQRAVLSAGVMIALALIPSMSIAGMALAAGNLSLAHRALERWGIEAGAVIVSSGLVLTAKHLFVHQRRTALS